MYYYYFVCVCACVFIHEPLVWPKLEKKKQKNKTNGWTKKMAGKFSLASRSNEILSPNNMTWCLMPDTRLRLRPVPFVSPNPALSPACRPSLIRFSPVNLPVYARVCASVHPTQPRRYVFFFIPPGCWRDHDVCVHVK